MAPMLRDALVGTAAGLAATEVMDRVSTWIYERTDPEDIRREDALEPLSPPMALVKQLESRWDLSLTKPQEQQLGSVVHYATGLTPAVLYAWTARRSPLGWLAGGLVFGTLFWALMDEGVGPAMGLVGDNRKYPLEAHLRGLAAHVVFGVVVAGLVQALGVRREAR